MVSFCLTQNQGDRSIKDYVIAFTVAFLAFGLAFLAVDYAVMHAQGLTVIYTP